MSNQSTFWLMHMFKKIVWYAWLTCQMPAQWSQLLRRVERSNLLQPGDGVGHRLNCRGLQHFPHDPCHLLVLKEGQDLDPQDGLLQGHSKNLRQGVFSEVVVVPVRERV